MNEKTCSGDWGSCQYACYGTSFYLFCKFQGYCDFQLPRDSREEIKIEPEKEKTLKSGQNLASEGHVDDDPL